MLPEDRPKSSSSTSPGKHKGPASVNPEVSNKICGRYHDAVKTSEQERKSLYVPLDQQDQIGPDERELARMVHDDLDTVLGRIGQGSTKDKGWDTLVTSDSFQKRIQFLVGHARTGHFIEQYGTQGRYDGEFLYGMRHGKGSHEFRGEIYEGEWKWDYRHGWGTLSLGDGSKITGEWQSGKPHGFTTIIDTKGTVVYEGEFKEGKRHGLGRQLFESGDMYDGGWNQGRLHDRGVYYFTNGDKLYGMWREGLYDGIGVFHYSDGSISRRVYKDGLLMSVQDYEYSSQRFGKTLTRDGMQKHTRDKEFPKEVFLLNSV